MVPVMSLELENIYNQIIECKKGRNWEFGRSTFVSIKSFRDVIPLCRFDRRLNLVGEIVHMEQQILKV